ncbi:MAG: antibiotic biosynthesis monooxygenase family protein [Isosphaeraceae bacterium]
MIHVIATLTVESGRRPELLAAFKRLVPLVQAEAGCIEYGPTVEVATGLPVQCPARPDAMVVVEKWQSLEHLLAHLKAPHMAAFREEVAQILVETELVVTTPV